MHIKDPVELVYLALMLRWERSAPPDKCQGHIDGKPVQNSQISRMAYILNKVAVGSVERTFQTLARFTRRKDGKSYISKDASWMGKPHPLLDGWYFEGCTSLLQKQEILQHLTNVGVSAVFAASTDDFVAGNSVESYLPTNEEYKEIHREIVRKEFEQPETAHDSVLLNFLQSKFAEEIATLADHLRV